MLDLLFSGRVLRVIHYDCIKIVLSISILSFERKSNTTPIHPRMAKDGIHCLSFLNSSYVSENASSLATHTHHIIVQTITETSFFSSLNSI